MFRRSAAPAAETTLLVAGSFLKAEAHSFDQCSSSFVAAAVPPSARAPQAHNMHGIVLLARS